MYAKITKDLLFDGSTIATDRTGVVLLEEPPVTEKLTVRLLDDDGEIYYEAEADDEGLEPLFDWGYRDSGTTLLEQLIDGKWKGVIS